jgi:hypothetical protein
MRSCFTLTSVGENFIAPLQLTKIMRGKNPDSKIKDSNSFDGSISYQLDVTMVPTAQPNNSSIRK